jgi:Bacterial extracellular solute-binding protein
MTSKRRSLARYACWRLAVILGVISFTHLSSGASVEDVALMKSADRQKLLVEGAKKEGKVTFYTGLIVDQVVRPLKEGFEKEYPFVQVDFFRGNSENIARRVLTEYQAKRYDVDVVSGSAATSMVQRAGFMQRFYSPHLAEYPAELKDSKGFWGSTNVYFMTLGYNTRNVKANELPKTYEDLLNPRWKGQMMWSTSRGSGAPQFIGNILLTMGQEAGKAYLQKLKGQNIAKSTASARQISRPGDRRRISAGCADLQSSCLYQQSSWGTGGVAATGTGDGDYKHDRPGEEFTAAARGHVVPRLFAIQKRTEDRAGVELSTLASGDSRSAGGPQTRRWQIQKSQLHQPGRSLRSGQ